MATIPVLPTEAPGNFNTSALWNANVLGGLGYLLAPVRFKGYASTAQAIANGSGAGSVLTLDTEIVDSDGGHSTTTNTSRFTAQTAGLYAAMGSVCFATNGTGTRSLQVMLNGTTVPGSLGQFPASSVNGGTATTATTVQMNVGDYVELFTWQTSGSALNTSTGTGQGVNTTMNLWRISA